MADWKRMHPILKFIANNKIYVLLTSILLILLVPPFLPRDSIIEELYLKIILLIIALASYFIVRKIKISRFVAYLIIIAIIINILFDRNIFSYVAQIGISILIINAFVLVLKEAISLKGETKSMILVSITGYLIIGLIGGFLSAILEYIYPNSFYHTTGMELDLYNFIYYGFVTMTTLGYGDIVPVNEKSQALALVLVLTGQLFLTIIIAINIAKLIQRKIK